MVVSGSLRARAKVVKAAAVSPSPCRRRRIFGDGDGDGDGEGVIVRVRLEGKSDWVGFLVGMIGLVRDESSVHSCLFEDRTGGPLSVALGCLLDAPLRQLSLRISWSSFETSTLEGQAEGGPRWLSCPGQGVCGARMLITSRWLSRGDGVLALVRKKLGEELTGAAMTMAFAIALRMLITQWPSWTDLRGAVGCCGMTMRRRGLSAGIFGIGAACADLVVLGL